MAVTATTKTGSWSFGAEESGFYGKIILDENKNISVEILEGSMELNALYLTNNDTDGLLNDRAVGGSKIKGLRGDREYKFVRDYEGNTGIESLNEVTEEEKIDINKASSSLNMNGVKDEEGNIVKWDSMVSIDSTGLAGDTSYLLDASSENSTYTLTREQRDYLLKTSGLISLEEICDFNFGIRGTSVGEDQEDSVKLYSNGFMKDEPVFTGDEFDTGREVNVRQLEGLNEYSFGGSKQLTTSATLTTAERLAIDETTPDDIVNISKLSSSADDFFLLGRANELESMVSIDEESDVLTGYKSLDFALSKGQILKVKDSDAGTSYQAETSGIYSVTRDGIEFNGKLVAESGPIGDGNSLVWNVSGDGLYGLDMTLSTNTTTFEAAQEVAV